MKIKLDCPFAYHGEYMRVYCKKNGELCRHQFYRNCKGWWVNSPVAKDCLLRKENDNARQNAEA